MNPLLFKDFIKKKISQKNNSVELTDKLDLIESGVIDSLGFLELVSAIETKFNIDIDLSIYDPPQYTTIKDLVRICQHAKKK